MLPHDATQRDTTVLCNDLRSAISEGFRLYRVSEKAIPHCCLVTETKLEEFRGLKWHV